MSICNAYLPHSISLTQLDDPTAIRAVSCLFCVHTIHPGDWIYDLRAKDFCEKQAKRKVVTQHKSALFTRSGSSGTPPTELRAHPPKVGLPPGQPAGPAESPLSAHYIPKTTKHDSGSISLIKPHPGSNTLPSLMRTQRVWSWKTDENEQVTCVPETETEQSYRKRNAFHHMLTFWPSAIQLTIKWFKVSWKHSVSFSDNIPCI